MYVVVTVGIAGPDRRANRIPDQELDAMIDHVETLNGAVGPGDIGASMQFTMTIAAGSVLQAIRIGVAHVERYGEPLYVEAEPERRRDLREGFRVAPAWLGVNDVAARLNISRQRVQQLITSGELPAERIGNAWAVQDTVVDRLAARRRAQEVSAQSGP